MHPRSGVRYASDIRELASLARVLARFWLRIAPRVRAELREWERVAATIPHPELRAAAVGTLRSERLSAMGAALLAATSDRHDPALVRLLVALQVAWHYIDALAEQPATDPVANGVQLHRALVDALGPDAPRGDYYRVRGAGDDGGYLAALVGACREACATLPAYGPVRAAAVEALHRAEAQHLHHAHPSHRVSLLRQRAARDRDAAHDTGWIELAAAATSSFGVLAMLAAAADPATTECSVERVRAAYMPWIDALTALLDSLVDRAEDAADGSLNWIDQYPSPALAVARLRDVTTRAIAGARRLPRGERHVVVVAGMVALYLSQAAAWTPEARPAASAVLRASDTPATGVLLAMLRCWRSAAHRTRR